MSAKQIEAWGKTRERGMLRYVFGNGGVWCAVGLFVGTALSRWHRGLALDDPWFLGISAIVFASFVLIAIIMWYGNESEFHGALAQGEKK